MKRKGIPMKAFACLLAAAMAMSPITGVSAKAADILADKCGCDVIARFEIDGDAVEVDNLIKLQKRYSDECYVSEYLFL